MHKMNGRLRGQTMRTDFDFHQLSHFLAVAKTGNFTQAAAEIGISQPALSRSIQKLEKNGR